MNPKNQPMDVLILATQELAAATAAHEQAQHLARETAHKATDRQNQLIAAQKAFDIAVANVKKAAPYGGEWRTAV